MRSLSVPLEVPDWPAEEGFAAAFQCRVRREETWSGSSPHATLPQQATANPASMTICETLQGMVVSCILASNDITTGAVPGLVGSIGQVGVEGLADSSG